MNFNEGQFWGNLNCMMCIIVNEYRDLKQNKCYFNSYEVEDKKNLISHIHKKRSKLQKLDFVKSNQVKFISII